jgi:hypothetical protein
MGYPMKLPGGVVKTKAGGVSLELNRGGGIKGVGASRK